MSAETQCTWCGTTPVFWRTTCECCYRIFERVERALKGTRFTSDERRLFTEAIIADPNGLEAKKLQWIEEYRDADPVKAAIMERDLAAIRRLCGESVPAVQ
jgi:hypothetical protein